MCYKYVINSPDWKLTLLKSKDLKRNPNCAAIVRFF